ncbi:hypothetical protein Tco_1544019, partial [Tanacetum coccineum]
MKKVTRAAAIREVAATGWGDEFKEEDQPPTTKFMVREHDTIDSSESEWENPFAVKSGGNQENNENEESCFHLNEDEELPYPNLPPAYAGTGALLTLPEDPGLWDDTISRWESITINMLNSQSWPDNKSKLLYVKNLLGEQEKLMWQQWRTSYPEVYEILIGMADDPQNITSHMRTVLMMEDPYRGSTERQDIALRDLDRLTCEDTKDLCDKSSVYSIFEGEGELHVGIVVGKEEFIFMVYEEDYEDESDKDEMAF